MVVPENADPILKKCVTNFLLRPTEIYKFNRIFQGLDVMRTGTIPVSKMFEVCEARRNAYTDALFSLFEIDLEDDEDPQITFDQFIIFITSYCMFESKDIVKFCLYFFDQDKSGYFSQEDAKTLMNILHNVVAPETVKGNVKLSWKKLKFREDDKVDIDDLTNMHREFPKLFAPAFALQNQLMIHYMGEFWWISKKNQIKDHKAAADKLIQYKKAQREKKKRAKAQRKVRRAMGLLRYYLCPCLRYMYDPDWADTHMTDEQKKERQRQMALARRMADLAAKNPKTNVWQAYEKKIDPQLGGSESFVIEKQVKTERHREVRASGRAERKAERLKDKELQTKVVIQTIHIEE